VDFNESKLTYRDAVERSVAFSGKGLEFFTRVKADCLIRIVREHLPGVSHPRLLDVGCGHGFIHPDLIGAGMEVSGVDVAGDVLPIARAHNPDVRYLEFDGSRLPFEAHSFDVVSAICVMHHVPPDHWPGFVAEMRRVLRPGGIAAVFEHNPWNPLTRYVVASNDIDADAVLLARTTLRRLLGGAGFSQVKARDILFTPFDRPLFRALDRALGWCPMGAQYYALGIA